MEEKKTRTFKDDIINIIKTVVPAFLAALFITQVLVANAVVPSGSMEPTVMTGARLFGNRLAYSFGTDPERGDIIIFRYPDDPSQYFIKRLIGVPGDVVEIIPDEENEISYVAVNGERLDEPYIAEDMRLQKYQRFEVPEDCYFFLGDNRNYSNDARFWDTTYVTRDRLIAKAVMQYWPPFKMLN